MTTTKQTVVGRWSVVERQRRPHGQWVMQNRFEPGEWEIEFFTNGRLHIDFSANGAIPQHRVGGWAYDPVAEIILFDVDNDTLEAVAIPGEYADGMIFDTAEDGPWLYYFEDFPDIRPFRETIIGRHAYERHKLRAVR